MLLDLAMLKERLGIPVNDVTKDAVITLVAEQAQALAETYTDRAFDLMESDEVFPAVTSSFQVRRYPITEITAIAVGTQLDLPVPSGAAITSYRADAEKGLVWPWPGGYSSGRASPLRCIYTGGYAEAPRDLEWALTGIFDLIWAATPGGALPPGAPGGGAFDTVKKFSVVGAYSVELGSSGDPGGGSSGGGGDNNWGILTPVQTSVLDRYCRGSVMGIS
jgi:hypothetical protein